MKAAQCLERRSCLGSTTQLAGCRRNQNRSSDVTREVRPLQLGQSFLVLTTAVVVCSKDVVERAQMLWIEVDGAANQRQPTIPIARQREERSHEGRSRT